MLDAAIQLVPFVPPPAPTQTVLRVRGTRRTSESRIDCSRQMFLQSMRSEATFTNSGVWVHCPVQLVGERSRLIRSDSARQRLSTKPGELLPSYRRSGPAYRMQFTIRQHSTERICSKTVAPWPSHSLYAQNRFLAVPGWLSIRYPTTNNIDHSRPASTYRFHERRSVKTVLSRATSE